VNTRYQQALSLLNNGQPDAAEPLYQQLLAENAGCGLLLNDLGVIAYLRKNYPEAIKYYEAAVLFDPHNAKICLNFGNSLRELGYLEGTERCYNSAYEYDQDINWRLRVLEQLIAVALTANRRAAAHDYWRKVISTDPNSIFNRHNYANFLQETIGDYTAACALYEQLVGNDDYPGLAQLYNDWGVALKNLGETDRARLLYEQSLAIRPQAHIYSNMLYDLLFPDTEDNLAILRTHRQYPLLFQHLMPQRFTHPPVFAESRRLRIGYISPDFRYHSVGMFCQSVFDQHNRAEFELFCYYTCPVTDEYTPKFQAVADHWRAVAGSSPDDLAQLIYNDKIDILIDLSGHTKGNYLPVFLAKPAPLQMAWIGYTFSTGLDDVDYFITDVIAAPVGRVEDQFCEQLLRLPQCFLCYTPHENLPALSPTPALANSAITFGLFGNFAKITRTTLELCAATLAAVPGSKLLLQSAVMSDATGRHNALDRFAACGVDAGRLLLHDRVDAPTDYLNSFNKIDILLDWYPFNGETITCNALSMGVPVVSLYGDSHRSRAGLSILTALGRPEWVAGNREEFVNIVVDLCSDIGKLNIIRQGLRNEFLNSPLCDAKTFTAQLEQAYKDCWKKLQESRDETGARL